MNFIKKDNFGGSTINGAACGSGIVCPSALVSDCNQSSGYEGKAATLSSDTQVNNGGVYSK